jgi:hypothetical protein
MDASSRKVLADAQDDLGLYEQAEVNYRIAAVENAALNLGILLDKKVGRPSDEEAEREYHTLLEQGDARAHENLAELLRRQGTHRGGIGARADDSAGV